MTNKLFKDKLIEAIEKSGRLKVDIAADAGIAPASLSRLLNKESKRRPHKTTLRALAKALGKNENFFLKSDFSS